MILTLLHMCCSRPRLHWASLHSPDLYQSTQKGCHPQSRPLLVTHFSEEQEDCYRQRCEEGMICMMHPEYLCWLETCYSEAIPTDRCTLLPEQALPFQPSSSGSVVEHFSSVSPRVMGSWSPLEAVSVVGSTCSTAIEASSWSHIQWCNEVFTTYTKHLPDLSII